MPRCMALFRQFDQAPQAPLLEKEEATFQTKSVSGREEKHCAGLPAGVVDGNQDMSFGDPRFFAYIGHINFSNWKFALVKLSLALKLDDAWLLQTDPADALGAAQPMGELHTDLQFFRDALDLQKPWMVSVCTISEKSKHWPMPPPIPELIPVALAAGELQVEPFICWHGSDAEAKRRKDAEANARDKASKRNKKNRLEDRDGLDAALRLMPPAKKARTSRKPDQEKGLYQLEDSDNDAEVLEPNISDGSYEPSIAPGGPADWFGCIESEAESQDLESHLEDLVAEQTANNGNGNETDSDSEISKECPSPHDCSDREAEGDSQHAHELQVQASAEGNASAEDEKNHAPLLVEVASDSVPVAAPGAGAADEGNGSDEIATARAARASGPRDMAGTQHLKVGHYGEIRYIPASNQLVAVCDFPGHDDCRRTRTCSASNALRTALQQGQGRPLGQLTHWLRQQSSFETQQNHCHGFSASYEDRAAARTYLLSLPGGQEFAHQHERPKRDGEADEPTSIR